MSTSAGPDPKSGKVLPAELAVGAPVYALGALSFDFGTLERRDVMFAANGGPILTNADLLHFLQGSPTPVADFESVIWTLLVDGDPVYAIRSAPGHSLNDWNLTTVLENAIGANPGLPPIDRLAVPGLVSGSVSLLDGRVVPVIDPDVRGIQYWSGQAVALAVGLAGSFALSPATVNLTTEGTLDWTDWSQPESLAAVRRAGANLISDMSIPGPSGPFMTLLVTSYTGSTVAMTWTGGTPVPNPPVIAPATFPQPPGDTSGVSISAAGGGLTFTAPADTTPRVLRIYARTFSSTGRLTATLSDNSAAPYVDTSFNAFPSMAGVPGAVDGVYTLVYQAKQPNQTLTVQLTGTAATAMSRDLQTVFAYRDYPSGFVAPVPAQALGIGAWPASTLDPNSAYLNLSSAFVPAGLRLTIFNRDNFQAAGPGPGAAVLMPTPPGTLVTGAPGALNDQTQSLIVEPENYVGIQAATLALGPAPGSPLVGASAQQDFMDRVYYLLRNLGTTSAERAMNYGMTQAAAVPGMPAQPAPHLVLSNAMAAGLSLESIAAERAPSTRPGSDCWDVELVFFSPLQAQQAGRTYVRTTVDVANVRPTTITPARTWTQY